VLPLRVRLSLNAVHAVAAATLLRSIVFDRWITVLASLFLIGGAFAAQRGKTWGIGLALGAAASFPTAWVIGIAPPWFCVVGALGALPFVLTSRAIARFDAAATALGAGLALIVGTLGAVGWRAAAPFLFVQIPALRPSRHATHGGFLVALLATAACVAMLAVWKRARVEGFATPSLARGLVRVDAPVTRIANDEDAESEAFEDPSSERSGPNHA
jgi:hypothetical protein